MTTQNGWPRELTVLLFAHARRVVPRNRAEWAQAMEQEAANIADSKAALFWALGSVAASYIELIKSEHFLLRLMIRLSLSYVCVIYALEELSSPGVSPECQQYGNAHSPRLPFEQILFPKETKFPSLLTNCHNWDWTVPVPLLIKALWLVTAFLYFLTALRLLQNRASSFPVYLFALISSMIVVVVRMFIHADYYGDPFWHWQVPELWGLGSFLSSGPALFVGVLFPAIVGIAIGLMALTGGVREIAQRA